MSSLELKDMSLLEEITKLEPVKNMKVSVNYSVKYGALVGAATIASGILGGPLGLAAGGVVSSCIAGYTLRGKFNSVPYILCNETTPQQREKLLELIHNLLKSKHIHTIRDFILSTQNNTQLVEAIIQILIMFLSSEMNINVKI